MQPDDMKELLELCNSDDPIERFEAFEELWENALHQGTPSADAFSIFQLLLDWIESGHPDWVDILDSIYRSGLDLGEGPTRSPGENARRIETFGTIIGRRDVFETVLRGPCFLSGGLCRPHNAAAELLRIANSTQDDWLVTTCIRLIQEHPHSHANLWTTVDRLSALGGLSSEDLYLCAEQAEVESVKRSALFHLTSRGDQRGITGLRQAVQNFNQIVIPTVEEAAILVRKPPNVPFDLLTDLYRRATDIRAVHDLACGVLRKAADDDRDGWELVSEKRVGRRLVIRHPIVQPPRGPNPIAEALFYRDDLLRNRRLFLVDTDMWALLGLPQP